MLWSHDVPCGVLCFHVAWLVGLVGWCVGCLAGWVVWQLRQFVGCLAGCGMSCGVCSLWCAVALCCMLSDVTYVSTPVFVAIPREGGALVSITYFCSSGVRGNGSSGDLATL